MESAKLLSSLQSVIASLVERRTRDNAATLITFVNGEAVLNRRVVQPDAASSAGLIESLAASHSLWQPIGRMRRIIDSPIISELTGVVNLRAWRLTSLSFQTAWACLAAKKLAEKMDASLLCEVNEAAAGEKLYKAQGKCIDDFEKAVGLVENTAREISQAIAFYRSNPSGEPTAAIEFESAGPAVQAIHLNGQGEELFKEPLHDFINRAASFGLSYFIESVQRLNERLPCHQALGDRILRQICPVMAAVLQRVVRNGQFLGYRMFRGTSRGFPAEAILFHRTGCSLAGRSFCLFNRAARAQRVYTGKRPTTAAMVLVPSGADPG